MNHIIFEWKPSTMRYFYFLFIICFFSCTNENQINELIDINATLDVAIASEENTPNTLVSEYSDYEFPCLNILINDTVRVPLNGSSLCLNHDLDSLTKMTDLYMFQLIDVNNDIVIINWPPFMGAMLIDRIGDNKYTFTGNANFPVNGDWEIPFVKHDILKYVFEIHADHYCVYRDKDIRLNLPYSKERINELEKAIMASEECLSKDWDVATSCFDQIKQYEYHLFAAVIAGESIYEEDYFNLRSTVSLVNAGQFFEYLEGNYYLLKFYGILADRDYDDGLLRSAFARGEGTICH
ncbi:MAG: hypothetical protein ACI8ZM_001443 [Crocinitomix sp.]